MTSASDMVVVWIYAFLVITGAWSILYAVYQGMNPGPTMGADAPHSSVETKWFKLNAPALFIYGALSIGGVVAAVKFDQNRDLKAALQSSERQVSALRVEVEKLMVRINAREPGTGGAQRFEVKVSEREPTSLFEGAVLVIFTHNAFSPNVMECRGSAGTSRSPDGPFGLAPIPVQQGDRLFMRTSAGSVWGINVLKDSGQLVLEFYRPEEVQK